MKILTFVLLQSGGHDDRVNDVSWHPTEDVLYSASDDQQIVEWHIPTKSVKW